jgi:hypothetical protein
MKPYTSSVTSIAPTAPKYDPVREAHEIRAQLSSDKRRLAFFLGAGTSQAVGIEGIVQLTTSVQADLTGDQQATYASLVGAGNTVEGVLDHLRLVREALRDSATANVNGLTGPAAADLDAEVCRRIAERVTIEPPRGIKPHVVLAHWLKSVSRAFPVEIFTPNYDLLIERGLESAETPHFDGFVGTVEPTFNIATVDPDEADATSVPPVDWVRVWKLHGSIAWRLRPGPDGKLTRVARIPGTPPSASDHVLIYPSRQKYSDSRRLPFLAYQDRLRRLLSRGESLLVVLGYSFSDEHINEIIFRSAAANNRLAVIVFSFDALDSALVKTNLTPFVSGMRNLTVYGPDAALIGGVMGTWETPSAPAPAALGAWPFWDSGSSRFTLGDFNHFAGFLERFLGARVPSDPPSATSAATATP